MTKQEILDRLLILKENLKGTAKQRLKAWADDATDYDFGYGKACEYYAVKVGELYDDLKLDLMQRKERKA